LLSCQTSAGFCLLLALMSLAQVSHGQGATCRHECIKLQDCPSLAQLLTNPSASDIKTLQEATCTVGSSGLDPLVCCDDAAPTRPRPAPLTQPLTSPDPVIRQAECGQTFPLAIVGGETAAFESEIWLALLGYRDSSSEDIQFLCAGSLINERYLVTAAHCVNPALLKPKQFKLEVIRVGEKDLQSDTNCNETPRPRCIPPSQDFIPEDIIQHPDYDSKTFANDIAIIRLSSPIDFITFEEYAGPVCLPPRSESAELLANRGLFSVDWGLTRTPSQFLNRYDVALVDTNDCNTTYNGRLTAGQICVRPMNTDACSGDGGSPLTATSPNSNAWQLLGVQTIGVGCGLSDLPTVYTSVSYHRDWIEQNIRP
ncbi:phenoloxidase-activating factor 1-like, partial [Penaeus indicus]|uniref:phenoloxidase-activating factor 1-like n=1 Tax=Penaeus indicus TaxID=29960 RepID=UPI00300D680D